ncbi:response regulator [Puniceicoccaceae bacterium K14]|nr:response regulator [Puniceicoccaceae bacterium K14]
MHSVLIVDDLESIHEMLDAVIEPIGYQTSFATSGQMALHSFREKPFDIVFTDINMPGMSGVELLSELKAINPNVIVIMMTGFGNVENAMESLKHGAFDFLTKPFKVNLLMESLNRAAARIAELANEPEIDAETASLEDFINEQAKTYVDSILKSVQYDAAKAAKILQCSEEEIANYS